MPDANSLLVRRATNRIGTNGGCCVTVWLLLVALLLLIWLLSFSAAALTRVGLKCEMIEARVEIVHTSMAPSKHSSKTPECSCRGSYS
jgi:hypothetical protein